MAYAHGITRDDVFTAANLIFAQGKNPTQAAVRASLGKGSFATISKYLQEWRLEQREGDVTVVEGQIIPEDDQIALNRLYWALRAKAEATGIAEQVELLEQENKELRERQENYDAIAAELAGMRFAHQQALERLDQLTRDNERLTQELEKTKTRKTRTRKTAVAQ